MTQPRLDSHPDAALVSVDWGTTSLRLAALDRHGNVLTEAHSAHGISAIEAGGFEAHLEATLAGWGDTRRPVIASGMITSRQGWVETPYLECPAPVARLADALHAVETRAGWRVHFVTGLSCRRADGTPDVLRGEETQVLGSGHRDGLLVLPGTHSKWVRLRTGAVESFATYMTGELFAALVERTILGRLMGDSVADDDDFARGVRTGAHASGDLLGKLFGVRSLGLFADVPEAHLKSYLSGLLIGTELRDARGEATAIVLLGRGDLVDAYRRAAGVLHLEAIAGPADSASAGHFAIARAASLVR